MNLVKGTSHKYMFAIRTIIQVTYRREDQTDHLHCVPNHAILLFDVGWGWFAWHSDEDQGSNTLDDT